ncbi:MAG: hypothetical protein RQ866_07945, partial [Bacteroidales bacterium]|nr:hypothetical protein [Bacteroidales bacterium]
GPTTLLDTIHSVFSVQQHFSDIDGDVHAKVKLTPPLSDEIRMNPKTIAVSLYAGRYTEKRFNLPIRLENNLSESAKIVPSKIELRCMVPLSDFQQVSANDFDVVAEIPADKSAPSKIMLKIEQKHPAAKKIRLFPDAVEHFIIKQ